MHVLLPFNPPGLQSARHSQSLSLLSICNNLDFCALKKVTTNCRALTFHPSRRRGPFDRAVAERELPNATLVFPFLLMARFCALESFPHSLPSPYHQPHTASSHPLSFASKPKPKPLNLETDSFLSGSLQLQSCPSRAKQRVSRSWGVGRAIQWTGADGLPTKEEIISAAKEIGVILELKTTGPLFAVTATGPGGESLGTSDGFIKPWVDGKILHLDSIRLTKASATRSGRSIFGAGVYMGALMVRHGIDSDCRRGELLAINDSDAYHMKLVRYYSRLGWTPVHEVKGDSWRDYLHMLVWGGVGTRMDADLRVLLGKWASTLRPGAKRKVSQQIAHSK